VNHKPSKSLSIPEPCHEDWSKMTEVDKGRFCNACQKEVTDFTVLTDREILLYFKKAGTAPVCGHARADQLNRPFYLPATRTRSLPRTLTAHLAASFLFLQAFFGPATAWGNPRHKQEISTPEPAVEKPAVIKGKVLDYSSGKPVAGIRISILETDLTVVTDNKGGFAINLPADFDSDSLTIRAKYTDASFIESHIIYDEQVRLNSQGARQEIILYQYPLGQTNDVTIEADRGRIFDGGIRFEERTFIQEKNPGFWKRLMGKFKKD
jgi:hypothetical protein